MTVSEMFYKKYKESLKTMNRTSWENVQLQSKESGIHPAQIIYMGLEITAFDIKENGGWNGELYQEIKQLHADKQLVSNLHRQAHGQVTAYWLTKKGFRVLNKDHAIC